jgi:hypothetical protein
LVVLSPASAAPNKPYSIVICGPINTLGGQTGCTSTHPAVIAPGGTTTFPSALSVTFTNDNKMGTGIQLGSDNLNVPSTLAGFSVISASLPTTPPTPVPQCPPSFNNSAPLCIVLLNGGATVGFRNLNLAPGQSISINLSATTPPPSTTACTTTSPCSWTDEAKQSNDFSGTGNDLNSDSNSSYGTVLSAVTSCQKKQTCSTTLADGGTATSAAGSISTTISTSSGKTTVTQLESLDFGPPLNQDPQNPAGPTNTVPNCSNVTSPHLTYENLSNGADNGSDRSETITTNTTDYQSNTTDPQGYESEYCFETKTPFTQLVIPTPGTQCYSTPTPAGCSLAPANSILLPDGTPGFVGLLPNCGNQALEVNCGKLPGVSSRQNPGAGEAVHTVVIAIPPGFDWRGGN